MEAGYVVGAQLRSTVVEWLHELRLWLSEDRDIYVPVRMTIEHDDAAPVPLSRLITNRLLLFVKWLFAIPLYIGFALLGIATFIVIFISFWVILFTGRLPEGLFNFIIYFLKYETRIFAYFPLLLTNHRLPNERHPVQITIDYPDRTYSRLVFVFLKLPSALLDVVLRLTALVIILLFLLAIPAWWIILIIGRYPRTWFDLSVPLLE